MNNNFKQQLQRYIDGELDTIYEELPKMTMSSKRKQREQQHQQQHQQQQQQQQQQQMLREQQHQQMLQEQQQQQQQQLIQEQQSLAAQQQLMQQQYMQQKQYSHSMHPVYNPYEQQHENLKDIYGVEHIDRHNNDNVKKLASELAEKILKTQTKVDYYKAMKKKASIKLEEHLRKKDEDCEPLMSLMLKNPMDSVIHDGHKFTVVNGKNKRYIKITKLK
jgi:hypothetical protein